MDMQLSMRHRVVVKWTTNPANFGYDGTKTSWSVERPMSLRKAAAMHRKIETEIGEGTYHAIKYFRNGGEITLAEINDVITNADYEKDFAYNAFVSRLNAGKFSK